MRTTKFLTIMAACALSIAGLGACSAERATTTDTTPSGSSGQSAETRAADTLIGIAMPTKSLERWNRDGAHLAELLEAQGYQTTLQYADNKVDQQITQLQNMITQGADVLVIASIDGTALGPVLQTAADNGVTVIAYDRLINATENVDYYVTFDNYKVGQLQGEYLAKQIESMQPPIYFEPFAGSPDDNNAKFFFAGAWDVLLPKVKDGTLTIRSGKSPASNEEWQSIGILGWGSDDAQSEMENRINSFYSDGEKVDVILSPNDSLALGIAQALEGAGYAPGDQYPLLTGQDCDVANIKNLIQGKQAMDVLKNTKLEGERTAIMIGQILKGETVEVNDTESYHNGVKAVPTFLLEPQTVTKDNVKEILVDSGFHTAADLGL